MSKHQDNTVLAVRAKHGNSRQRVSMENVNHIELGSLAQQREIDILKTIESGCREGYPYDVVADKDLNYQYAALKDLEEYGLIKSCFTNFKRYAYTLTPFGKLYLKQLTTDNHS